MNIFNYFLVCQPGGSILTVTSSDGSQDTCLVLVVPQSTEVILTVGKREASVNGTQLWLAVAPYLKTSVGDRKSVV